MDNPDATWDRVRALEATYDDLVRRTLAGEITLDEGCEELRRALRASPPDVLAMSWRFHRLKRDLRPRRWEDGEWQGT
jgi:hypothetical protein